jgi:hypothetical protein
MLGSFEKDRAKGSNSSGRSVSNPAIVAAIRLIW